MHHVSAVQLVLASPALPDDVRRDSSGELLVWPPHPGFATYLHVGSAQIRGYGIRGPLVLAALLQMLAAVAQDCVDGSRRAAVRAQIDLVVRASQREHTEESDRALVAGAAPRPRWSTSPGHWRHRRPPLAWWLPPQRPSRLARREPKAVRVAPVPIDREGVTSARRVPERCCPDRGIPGCTPARCP